MIRRVLGGMERRKARMRIEESVEINRPPEEVFNYVANPQNLPEWSGIVL